MEELLSENNLYFVESEEKYRSVLTNVKIKKGTLILSSPAMGLVLMESVRQDYCHQCLSLLQSKNKNRCSRCKVAHYCSRECQVKAWKAGHKYTCKLWQEKKLFDNDIMDVDLLVQVALKIHRTSEKEGQKSNKKDETTKAKDQHKKSSSSKEEKEEVGSMAPDKIKDIQESQETLSKVSWAEKEAAINREAFLSLMTHQDKIEFNEWKYLRDMAQAVLLITPELKEKGVTESELIEHLLRFKCNNFVYHDTQLFGIAEAAFPVGSLFNHSCRPNATLYYHEGRQIVRAMRDIARGEEVTITYTDVMNARTTRQKLLKEKYKFECRCERCQEEGHGLDQKLIALEEEEEGKEKGEKEKEKEKDGDREKKEKEDKEKDFAWIKKQFNLSHSHSHTTEEISLHTLLNPQPLPAAKMEKIMKAVEEAPLLKLMVTVATKLLPVMKGIMDEDEAFGKVHEEVVEAIEPVHLKTFTRVCQYTYHCIDEGAYQEAAYAAVYVLMVYLVFLDRHHPLTGLQWLTVGKLVWNCGDEYRKEAVYALEQAKRVIKVAEGRSDVLEEIENLIQQFS